MRLLASSSRMMDEQLDIDKISNYGNKNNKFDLSLTCAISTTKKAQSKFGSVGINWARCRLSCRFRMTCCWHLAFLYLTQYYEINLMEQMEYLKNLIVLISGLLNQQIMAAKHAVSCFDGTLDGWDKQSPEKKHVRQSSLLHQLQSNLHKYEDESLKMQKPKHEPESVRLPLLTNTRSNINLQAYRALQRTAKMDQQMFTKKALPLRMKTLMLSEKTQSENVEVRPKKNQSRCNENKDKFRKKVVVNFERIKEVGLNCLQFSDEMFSKQTLTLQEKSKSVKLHPIVK